MKQINYIFKKHSLHLLFLFLATVNAVPANAGQFDAEIQQTRTLTDEYVQTMSGRIRAVGRLSSVFARLARALERVTDARQEVKESCRSVWNDQARLEVCLADQGRTLDELSGELRAARQVVEWARSQVPGICQSLSQEPQQINDKISQQAVLLDRVEQNIITEGRRRLAVGHAHFLRTYGRQASAPSRALVRRLDGLVEAYRFISDLAASQRTFSDNVTTAITQKRYLKALSQLGAMEWVFSQITPMSQGALSPQALQNRDVQTRLRTETALFENALNRIRAQVSAAALNRGQMIEVRLRAVRLQVETATLLRADKTKMIEILDSAQQSLVLYRSGHDLEKLRITEVLTERVAAWLEGSF